MAYGEILTIMNKNLDEFIYKKVSLWLSIFALVGVVVSAVFFIASIQTELALINQKLENHIVHINETVDDNNEAIKENQKIIKKIEIDIAEIKILLKK